MIEVCELQKNDNRGKIEEEGRKYHIFKETFYIKMQSYYSREIDFSSYKTINSCILYSERILYHEI